MLRKTLLTILFFLMVGSAFGKQTKTVDAADFGYNTFNATAAVQTAIDSGADIVRISNQRSPWILSPIKLRSNLKLVFSSNVTITTKIDAYYDANDAVFFGEELKNVSMYGNNSNIYMRRDDYISGGLYQSGQWRHGIIFLSSKNIIIDGFNIHNTGGDGVFIGAYPNRKPCKKVLINNIHSYNCYRLGFGINSCVGLVMRNCSATNTNGHEPQSGIDIEFDSPDAKLQNILIENCRFIDNKFAGIVVHSLLTNSTTEKTSILFKNCFVTSSRPDSHGIHIAGPKINGVNGVLRFENCTVDNVTGNGIWLINRYAYKTAQVQFIRMKLKNCIEGINNPIYLVTNYDQNDQAPEYGNIYLDDVIIENNDGTIKDYFYCNASAESLGAANIHGNIITRGSTIGSIHLGNFAHDISLKLE